MGEEKKDGRVERSALKIGGDGEERKERKRQNLSRGRHEDVKAGSFGLRGRNLQDVPEEASFWSRLIHTMRHSGDNLVWGDRFGGKPSNVRG